MHGFKCICDLFMSNKESIKSFDEESGKAYILEVDVKYPKELHDLHSIASFLTERIKID